MQIRRPIFALLALVSIVIVYVTRRNAMTIVDTMELYTAPPPTLPPTSPPTPLPTPPPMRSVFPKSDSMEDWFLVWTGKPLTRENVPIPAGPTIPDRLFMTWKSKELPTEPPTARQYWDNWGRNEPHLDRIILDDNECAVLATFYPDLKPRYDALPLNVMRADVCRVLAVYYFGGYYKDMDVDWRKPLKDWIVTTDDVVYGWEDEEHYCQWFYAAKPGDPCVHSILQHITNIIANTSLIDFKKNIEAVIDITGPGVWTDAMQGCPWKPKYRYDDMKFHNVYHDYASQRWDGKDYKSWTKDRKEKAGWAEIWPAFQIRPYYMTPADEHLMPLNTEYAEIEVENVVQSTVRYGLNRLAGPANAFDGLLDTYVETEHEEQPHFEFTFATPLTIATVLHPNETLLTGIRVYNRHREPGAQDFAEGLTMELFDPDGNMFHRLIKQKRMATFFLFNLAGMPNKIKRVRFYKKPDLAPEIPQPHRPRLTFAEIQLYSDHLCLSARRVKVRGVQSLPELLTLATTIRYRCPNAIALSPQMGFQYAYCGTPPPNCTAFSITAKEQTEIDSAFVAKMSELGCPMTTIGATPASLSKNVDVIPEVHAHINARWCATNAVWSRCDAFEQMVKATKVDRATLVYLDVIAEDWTSPTSILSLLDRFDADVVLIPLRLTAAVLVSPTAVANFRRLVARYDLYAVHVNPGQGDLEVNGITAPREFHLSFRPHSR
jgi:mannosyltransferase OCH1-like enzyme